MQHEDDLSRESSLVELDPSPIEESPSTSYNEYFPPSTDPKDAPSLPGPGGHKTGSTFGLSSHSTTWYLNRIQKYSSYAFSVFTAFHIANTAVIPLITTSVPASERYLLLTRPYYQSPLAEPLVIVAPLIAHIGSGIALRIHRRRQNLKHYGAEERSDRRKVAWPPISGSSKLGYLLIPLVAGHAFINRVLPLWTIGGSSDVGLAYVSHGFAKHPAVSFAGFSALVVVGVWHTTWGWAKWLRLNPSSVTIGGAEGQLMRKRRWYLINAASAVIAGIWLLGGLGVVGRGGRVEGWVGREYDAILSRIPLIGGWMASS